MECGRTVYTEAVKNFVYANNICSSVPHCIFNLYSKQCYVNFSLL